MVVEVFMVCVNARLVCVGMSDCRLGRTGDFVKLSAPAPLRQSPNRSDPAVGLAPCCYCRQFSALARTGARLPVVGKLGQRHNGCGTSLSHGSSAVGFHAKQFVQDVDSYGHTWRARRAKTTPFAQSRAGMSCVCCRLCSGTHVWHSDVLRVRIGKSGYVNNFKVRSARKAIAVPLEHADAAWGFRCNGEARRLAGAVLQADCPQQSGFASPARDGAANWAPKTWQSTAAASPATRKSATLPRCQAAMLEVRRCCRQAQRPATARRLTPAKRAQLQHSGKAKKFCVECGVCLHETTTGGLACRRNNHQWPQPLVRFIARQTAARRRCTQAHLR